MSNTISLTPTNIDDPGTTYDFAFGINDGGTIACENEFGGASYEFANGTFSTFSLPFLYDGRINLEGINDLGDVVGSEGDLGFIDSGNLIQTVSAFGDFTVLTSINDSGDAVGYASTGTGYIGFTYQDDHVTALHDPLATGGTVPDDINNSGTIVGWYDSNGNGHGFVDINNTFTTVDDPLGTNTVVEGINNNGEIIGYYSNISVYPNPAYEAHGFIDIDNTFTTVNFVGNTGFQGLFGINDSGQVDGVMTNAAGQLEAVTANIPTSLLLPPTIANPITLSSGGVYPSPFTITSSQTISAGTHSAVSSSASAPFLQNDGVIRGNDVAIPGKDYGIDFTGGGTIYNALTTSTITAYIGVVIYDPGTVINYGTISGGVGVGLANGGYICNEGTASALMGSLVGIVNNPLPSDVMTIFNQGTISSSNESGIIIQGSKGSTITNAGTILGNEYAIKFQDTGADRLILNPGAVLIGNVGFSASASSTLEFAAGAGTLAGLGPTISNLQTLAFDPGAAWTLTGTADGFAKLQTISGFTGTDTLDITGFIGTISAFSDLTGLTLANGTTSETLALTSLESFGTLTAKPDGSGGTVITEVTCFCAGTRILTDQGEISVETLKIGDRVHTLHAGIQPIKWIGNRTYAAPFCNHPKILPIRIAAHAIAENIPARDLFVSPGHAIALDDALIHAARLVNGTTITQLSHADRVEYFHIELETHEVIFAENTPTETFLGEHFRNQFQNAQDFAARYPGATAPETHCLPPLDRGFHLAAILRRLNARAGIILPAGPGPLAGFIDSITPTRIIGWAADRAALFEPVILDIRSGTKTIGRTIANIPRQDVAAAGFGAGHHGFEFDLPPNTGGPITIRRTADAASIPHANTAIAA